jgi:hypothetical protein
VKQKTCRPNYIYERKEGRERGRGKKEGRKEKRREIKGRGRKEEKKEGRERQGGGREEGRQAKYCYTNYQLDNWQVVFISRIPF